MAQWNLSSGSSVAGIASNTIAGVTYEIFTNSDIATTNWGSTGLFIVGSETTNWTALPLMPASLTNNCFFRLRSDASSDGSGLPDWWEQEYGVTNPYGDPDGDGWNNLQEYQNGTDPNSFNTPATPQGLTVNYDSTSGTANLSWLGSPGPVTGYTVKDSDGNTFNVSVTSATQNVPYTPNFASWTDGDPTIYKTYQIQAQYADGSSTWSAKVPLQPATVYGNIIPNGSGGDLLDVGGIPFGAAAVRVFMFYTGVYFADNSEHAFVVTTNIDIPVEDFTNNVYPASSNWLNLATMPSYPYTSQHYFYLQSVDANGNVSGGNYLTENWGSGTFYDGRVQLKQNLILQFRIADAVTPFGFVSYTYDPTNGYSQPTDAFSPASYAYAGFYDINNANGIYGSQNNWPSLNISRPFEDNTLYRNFVFTPSDVNSNGDMTTGVSQYFDDGTNLCVILPLKYQPITNGTDSGFQFDVNTAPWLCTYPVMQWLGGNAMPNGITISSTYDPVYNSYYEPLFTLNSGARNYWGLPWIAASIFYMDDNGNMQNTVINAGDSLATWAPYDFYMEAAQPQFQTVEYDFWNDGLYGEPIGQPGLVKPPWYQGTTNLPGNSAFSPDRKSDLLIVGAGQSIGVAAFAKLGLQNGYAGAYGYLQQYLDKAYQIDQDGNVTTNTTGVVSPYGNYFATEAGPAALVTMPDPDTGEQGTCTVYCVSLQLDKNHDGVMDTSFNGPDVTSASSPYTFWCNNNFDRWDDDGIFLTPEQDDVQKGNDEGGEQNADPNTPDCNYHNLGGDRVIPDTRDLEDFARLWVCGITPDLVSNLPTGSTITLSWGDVGNPNSGNPTIDIFQAEDGDGGIGYLTNETTANFQLGSSLYVGRIAPGQGIQMPAYMFDSDHTRGHFIWCGVSNGIGGLTLTLADGSSNVLAQSTAYIQIKDIKQMHCRPIASEAATFPCGFS